MALRCEKFKNLSNQQIENLIDSWIHSERDRMIMKRRLIDGVCYDPISVEFDMSVRQIKDIVYKYQAQLIEKIE